MLAVLGASAPAQSQTTVSPVEPGNVVREGTVNLDVDVSAKSYWRSNASGTFASQSSITAFLLGRVCLGDKPDGTNNSPRTTLRVTDPNGDTVLTQQSPVRDLSDLLFAPTFEPTNPQPGPANSNYRGDFDGNNAYHGMRATLDLSGKPAGVYTVTTTHQNMVKTGSTACQIGTPSGTSFVPGESVETETFEYRPWSHRFNDALGNGSVRANVSPQEFTFSIGSKSSPIYQGTPQNQSFYSLNGAFLLPSNPETCVADLAACLPSGAVACDPATGCVPRLMVINQRFQGTPNGIVGVFDLDTKAFIAAAAVDGSQRVLFSLGSTNDALYHSLLERLAATLGGSGVDLMGILGTKITVANTQNQLSLSLLNGLQIDPTGPDGKGIRLYTPGTVQAGVILNVHSTLRLDGGACVPNTASSTDGPTRYQRNEPNGYRVNKSDLLPEVPSVGPLAAIVGGPVYNIQGKFTGGGTTVANVSTAAIGIDTAADEPHGYPVWISPFLSGIRTGSPKTMDFLGTATWSASETPLLAGCLVVDFMLGTGVAIYDNPLPVGLHSLIDPIGTPSPQLEALQDTVDSTVQRVLDTVTTNPAVESLLGNLVGSLPLSDLPVPVG